jgi:hypothetical protein
MNRHDRRRASKLNDELKMVTGVPLVVPMKVLRALGMEPIEEGIEFKVPWEFGNHPMKAPSPEDVGGSMVLAMAGIWINSIAITQPMCSLCDHRWTSLDDEPPAQLSVLGGFGNVMCTPQCRDCDALPGTLREKSGVSWEKDIGAFRLEARMRGFADKDLETLGRWESAGLEMIGKTIN